MSSWNIPEAGPDGANLEKPVLVFQSGIDINSVYQGLHAQEQVRQVHAAVALGWSLAELLGRCFLLQGEPEHPGAWDGAQLVALPESNTPREKIRALMEHIVFLASVLNVDAIPIDSDAAPGPGATYAGVLREDIRKFCSNRFDASKGETYQSVLGDINERLYFWDLKIHDALQNYTMVVHKAYLVGQSLASLRWYFTSLGNALDQAALDKICHNYIPLLGAYLAPFATGALSTSVEAWGQAAISHYKTQGAAPFNPDQLHTQSQIWYDILTGLRSPLSYVDPSTRGARYIWKVARVAWPLFLLHFLIILVILALALVVILTNLDVVLRGVTAITGLLALLVASHIALNNIGGIVEKALTQTGGAVKGSLIDSLWHSTQQKAVNQATFIAPPAPPATQPAGSSTPSSQTGNVAVKSG